jgi:hypothetical protein
MKVYTTQGSAASSGPPKADPANLIRLFIPCRFGMLPVSLAALLRSVNDGRTRPIYVLLTHTKETTAAIAIADFTLRSKAILGLTNVRYSVRSVKPGRTLICASYSKETSKSAPVQPLAG